MTAENDDFLNVYADYDLEENCVCDTLTVLLNRANGEQFAYKYQMNAEEQAVMTQKMDAYSMERFGESSVIAVSSIWKKMRSRLKL